MLPVCAFGTRTDERPNSPRKNCGGAMVWVCVENEKKTKLTSRSTALPYTTLCTQRRMEDFLREADKWKMKPIFASILFMSKLQMNAAEKEPQIQGNKNNGKMWDWKWNWRLERWAMTTPSIISNGNVLRLACNEEGWCSRAANRTKERPNYRC